MTTDKQLQANQENAKLSTGPKSEEGKAIAKLNSLKHGLLTREVLIEDENGEDLAELGKKIRNELEPAGEMELILVERIISNIWRLKRALMVEKSMMEWQRQEESEGLLSFSSRSGDQKHRQAHFHIQPGKRL